jgi:CheY-like chemotaxis protein
VSAVDDPSDSLPRQELDGVDAMRSLNILIADDNLDSVESLGMLLRASGYQVELAHDGSEAVETAMRMRPDVVILDIGMPRMNGYDAARRIREQEPNRSALLIAITGWGQDLDRRRSLEAGFDHHLIKPVEAEALDKLLQSFASSSRRPQQTRASEA